MDGSEPGRETLLAITQAILATLDPVVALQTLVEKARQLDGAKACAVFVYDGESTRLRIRYSSGLSDAYVDFIHVPADSSIAVSRAFQSGDAIIVTDVDSDPSYVPYLRDIHREEYKAIIAAPLMARNRLLGVFVVYYPRPFVPTEGNMGAIRTLANLAALAIDNAALYQSQVRATREVEALCGQLSEQSKILSQSLQIHEWLIQTVLVRDGLEAVAGALSDSAQATVVVEDRNLKTLCVSRPEGSRANAQSDPRDAGLIRFADHPSVRDSLARIRTGRRAEVLPGMPEIGLATARIIAPVFVNNSLLGFVSILESDRHFEKLDFFLCEQGAVAVALEMMKHRVAFEVEQKIRGDFIQRLLAGQFDNLDDANATMLSRGFDLHALQRILIVRPDTAEPAEERQVEHHVQAVLRQILEMAERIVVRLHSKSILVASRDSIIVLLGSDKELPDAEISSLADRLVRKVEEACPPTTVLVGIGGICHHFRELRRSYDEARKSLEVGTILGKRSSVLSFTDLGIYGIMLRQNDPGELQGFVHRYVGPLASYDRQHGGKLRQTLSTYVRNNHHLEDTARELSLHPKAVKYRLRKIETLCGLKLRESEDLVNLHLALRLYEVMACRSGTSLEPVHEFHLPG